MPAHAHEEVPKGNTHSPEKGRPTRTAPRNARKAKSEKGANVRFLPTDARPRLLVQGALPHLPELDGASGASVTGPAAHRLASAPALHFRAAVDASLDASLDAADPESRSQDGVFWTALAECDAHFPLEAWTTLMHTLVEHPERNSSYILRADLLAQMDASAPRRASRLAQVVSADDPDSDSSLEHEEHEEHEEVSRAAPVLQGYTLRQSVYRRLLPRNPSLDQPMDQLCYFYDRTTPSGPEGLVVYVPLLPPGGTEEQVPWYHPKVRALAFRFLALPGSDLEDGTPSTGQLRIDALLFSSPPRGTMADDPTSRLMRTAKALLDLQHKHTLGIARSYIKRVHHDVLVPQAAFQDRYIKLKQAHAPRLLASWKEATDPRKHVYEDLAIAAYLLELWARTYPHACPPGGFVDLGCGNGLLVHLLRSENIPGFGVDVRARQSWAQYETRRHLPIQERDLRVLPLDPPALVSDPGALAELLPASCFLIGNHADELTPWVPLLAAAAPGDQVGFINIPCCPWRLEGDRFGRSTFDVSPADVRLALARGGQSVGETDVDEARRAILLGPPTEDAQSQGATDVRAPAQARTRNAAYLAYVSWLHVQAGWVVEKEPLRIPSTKNWALVGRARTSSLGDFTYQSRPATADPNAEQVLVAGTLRPPAAAPCPPHVLDHVRHLTEGISWTARLPEGNTARLAPAQEAGEAAAAGDHAY